MYVPRVLSSLQTVLGQSMQGFTLASRQLGFCVKLTSLGYMSHHVVELNADVV